MTLEELGQKIQEQREAQGLSVDEVASHIKVSARILKAIEAGNAQLLPHAVYTKGFIRSFGQQVGLDMAEINEALERIFPLDEFDETSAHKAVPLIRPLPKSEAHKRLFALFILFFTLVALIAGGWYLSVTYGDTLLDIIKKPFTAASDTTNMTPLVAAANSSQWRNNSVASLPQATAMPLAQGAPHASNATQKALDPVAETHIQEPAASASQAVSSSPTTSSIASSTELTDLEKKTLANKQHIVFLSAVDECYIGITADTTALQHHMLRAGDTYPIVFTDTLKLLIGNAGGLTIRYDGQDMGAIGARGKPRLLMFP